MSAFPTAATVKAAIRAHLFGGGHRDAFVDVYLLPGKEESIYIITTTKASLVSLVQTSSRTAWGAAAPTCRAPSWCTVRKSAGCCASALGLAAASYALDTPRSEMSAAALDEKAYMPGGEGTKFLGSCGGTMVLIMCWPAEAAIEEQAVAPVGQ